MPNARVVEDPATRMGTLVAPIIQTAAHSVTWSNRGQPQRTLPSRITVGQLQGANLEQALQDIVNSVEVSYDGLMKLTKNELVDYCRTHQITGYSNLTKVPLVNHILAKYNSGSSQQLAPGPFEAVSPV